MADGDALARDAVVLDRARLVNAQADGVLGGQEGIEPAVGSAHSEQRAAHDAVGVPVDEVVEGVARGDGDGGDRVGERKGLRDEGLEGLG